MSNTHFLLVFFLLPTIHGSVAVKIHRFAVYNPTISCLFLRNISWSTDATIGSCIWECVYEKDCQTAVYFSNERLCSLFTESCNTENIHSSGNIQANVICYPKKQESSVTCPSTVTLSQLEMTTATTNYQSMPSINHKVLLLSDTSNAKVHILVNHLQFTGLMVNYASGGITTYNRTPCAASYQSIILISGSDFQTDMPTSGQQAIVSAQQNNGTGIVMTEAAAYHVYYQRWSILSSLVLAPYVSYTSGIISYTLIDNGYPIWNNLSNSFNTSVEITYANLSAPFNNSILIANCTTSGIPAVIVRPSNGTTGRIVHISHAAHFIVFNWGNDANLLTMMINAVRWAIKLI